MALPSFASDQGNDSKYACYPGEWGHCIKIGGANIYGQKPTWVRQDLVDYIFPGRNIPFETSNGTSITYDSGSSIATAAASGLTSLLICCNRLIKGSEDNYFRKKVFMTKALDVLSDKTSFPRVENYFDIKFKKLLLDDVQSSTMHPKFPFYSDTGERLE